MGRKRPADLRRSEPQRRRHGALPLPPAALRGQRTPAWLRSAEGLSHQAEMAANRGRPDSCTDGTKRRYTDQVGAARALAHAQADVRRPEGKREVRAYQCQNCDGWHLTSQLTHQPRRTA